ncbi:DUF805 domain-containing protein [Streptomyces sp. NPDC021020]|uniref:DUF805 domain-containing protein n=1 Tax=Streptomyces sp. NPDC021020 TaxID=3365109 RepID=UPI0037B6A912
MRWYIRALRKYADFDGRARRKEYWMYTLFTVIGFLVVGYVKLKMSSEIPYYTYLFAFLIPSTAVTCRRLHDIGKSGWFALLGFIPLIGVIIMLVFTTTEGDRGRNAYGLDPKQDDPTAYAAHPGY